MPKIRGVTIGFCLFLFVVVFTFSNRLFSEAYFCGGTPCHAQEFYCGGDPNCTVVVANPNESAANQSVKAIMQGVAGEMRAGLAMDAARAQAAFMKAWAEANLAAKSKFTGKPINGSLGAKEKPLPPGTHVVIQNPNIGPARRVEVLSREISGQNNKAKVEIAGGDPGKTNPRTGDPVDIVIGALELDIPLAQVSGSFPLSLSLHYNHQVYSPFQFFGPGFSMVEDGYFITSEYSSQTFKPLEGAPQFSTNILETKNRPENERDRYYFNAISSIQLEDGKKFYKGAPFWTSQEEVAQDVYARWPYLQTINPLIGVGPQSADHFDYRPPLTMELPSGEKDLFLPSLLPFDLCNDVVGNQPESENAYQTVCPLRLDDYPNLMERFIPIGFSLIVGYNLIPAHDGFFGQLPIRVPEQVIYQQEWARNPGPIPTHWLAEVRKNNRVLLSIDRKMTWEGAFNYPGKGCNSAQCRFDRSKAAVSSSAIFPYSVPYPRDFTMTYHTYNGEELTLRGRWHLESVAGDWNNGRVYRVFQMTPYIIGMEDTHGRHWAFDYIYPGVGNLCHYDWNQEVPTEVTHFLDPNLAGEICKPRFEEDVIRGRYTGKLFLRAVHYPDPVSGAATGLTKKFGWDDRGRIVRALNFDNSLMLLVNYDDNNRVHDQLLEGQTPITYTLVNNIADHELQDGRGQGFRGYEVEITTAGGRRSIVGIQNDGHIRYLREYFDRGPMQETSYEYRVVGLAKGQSLMTYYPDGRRVSLGLQDDANRYPHWPLTPEEINAVTKDHFFEAFRLTNQNFIIPQEGNQEHRLTLNYQYHPQTQYGFNLIQSVTDPLGRVTSYQYDFEAQNRCQTRLGLPAQVTYPDQSTEQFEYNNLGQPLFQRNRLGAETNFSYYGTGERCGQ